MPKKNVLAMTDAYRKVWLTTPYTNMKMLKEILAGNDCDIADLHERTLSDKPGRGLRQIGIKNIPDDPKQWRALTGVWVDYVPHLP